MHARLRMLMNAQPNDGSPGGGAPAGQGAPASAPASGTGGSTDILGQVKDLLAGELKSFRDGVFADLRKAGALGKGEKPTGETPAPQGGAQPLTAADVERISERASELGRGLAGLSDDQAAIMRRLFKADAPEDVGAWVKQTRASLGFNGAGGVGTPSTPAAPAAAAGAAAGGAGAPPKSDRGGQSGTVLTDDTPVIDMSDADREAWIKKNGFAKYYHRVQSELRGRKLRVQARK